MSSSYAKFFAEDLSTACDAVSWSTWIYVRNTKTILSKLLTLSQKLANMFQETAKLTSAHRKTMNDLVDDINSQIVCLSAINSPNKLSLTWTTVKSSAVKRAGNQIKFINYDHYVGYFNGRFCEQGVDESTKESNTR